MNLGLFLRGFLMGVCDVVPGISGGTIAFVTGIYERLIDSVKKNLSFHSVFEVLHVSFLFLFFNRKSNQKRFFDVVKEKDLVFLFNVFLGIFLAVFLASKVVLFLLNDFRLVTLSFFVGLIFASSFAVYRNISEHGVLQLLFAFLGFLFAFFLALLRPANFDVSLFYLFLSGFFAVFALFLPGISGAYILYLMGSYESILFGVTSDFFAVVPLFLLGAVFGAVVVSRLISYLLHSFHSYTLYLLFGFVLGSLAIPLQEIFSLFSGYFDYVFSGLSLLAGVFFVYLLIRFFE